MPLQAKERRGDVGGGKILRVVTGVADEIILQLGVVGEIAGDIAAIERVLDGIAGEPRGDLAEADELGIDVRRSVVPGDVDDVAAAGEGIELGFVGGGDGEVGDGFGAGAIGQEVAAAVPIDRRPGRAFG